MFKLFKKDEEEYSYFKIFEAISLLIAETAELLIIELKKDSFDSLEETIGDIKSIEKLARQLKKELLNYLYEDFLPPIERKDIIVLTHSLDQVLENTTDLIFHLDMYQIETIRQPMRKLMELLGKTVHRIPQLMIALEDFKHPQEIRIILGEMNEINIQGVQIYRLGVKELILGEMNSFDTMKYTKIYGGYDAVFQAIEELMNTVEAVIIENT